MRKAEQLQARQSRALGQPLEYIKPSPSLPKGAGSNLQGVVSTKGSQILLVEAYDSAVRACGCGSDGSGYLCRWFRQNTPLRKGETVPS